MALFYVTGVAGAGKSAVSTELARRQQIAFDADETVCAWFDTTTNTVVDQPASAERTQAWYERHKWLMSPAAVTELADKTAADIAFLCGTAINYRESWPVFDGVICLVVDEQTLLHRLATRENEFGKRPHEVADILSWHRPYEEICRDMGAIMVDATQPLPTVVDQVMAAGLALQQAAALQGPPESCLK